ncbi:MAG: glycosyltransferase 87 family protein [Bacteroidota bacterium]|mgnify:CR=1 FL=1
MPKVKASSWFLFIGSAFLYVFVEYDITRHDTFGLFSCAGVLFLIYAWVMRSVDESEVSYWLIASLLFRSSLWFALPNLSDDFYRFIWDGRLLAAGFHPFAELPRYYMEHSEVIPGIDRTLFEKLNSPDYFTIYPPISQFVFWLSVRLSPKSIFGSVVVIRSLIIASEVGSLLLIRKILKHYNLPNKNALLYALNPLVIIELTGNLHFEAFLIFFLLLSFWFLKKGNLMWAAFNFAAAICTKLIPIIFLPLLVTRLGLRRSFQFCLITGFCCVLLSLPLLNWEIISGFRESIAYYFKKFEFNASIYYLVREWGFWKYGYNIIQTVGWKLAVCCTASILLYTLWDFMQSSKFRIQDRLLMTVGLLPMDYIFLLSIYFAFSTIVHPWYITTLVAFSTFNTYRFAVLWAALIFLTYAGYTSDGFEENLWLTLIEYVLVMGYLVFEVMEKKRVDHHVAQEGIKS